MRIVFLGNAFLSHMVGLELLSVNRRFLMSTYVLFSLGSLSVDVFLWHLGLTKHFLHPFDFSS